MYQKRDEWLRILVDLHVGGGQNKYEKVEIHILSMFSSILLFMHTFLLSSREGHEDTKRGYREDNLDSDDEISPVLESQMIREKRQPEGNITGREGNENNTESDFSDSDDASETTPLLRGSRKTG